MMRLSAALLLLLPSLLAAPLLPAAEPAIAAAPEAEAAVAEATADDAGEAEDSRNQDSGEAAPAARAPGEDFVPSVRISEDLSVSFPTDI